IGSDITPEEADDIRSYWEGVLDEINKAETDSITVACGLVCGEGEYDIDALLSEADKRMYENKKEIKEKLGLPNR
ncbi:MAG: hypothetical protein IJ807_05410, partial [Eubacterium sp.]|nr:hypothetical protein [Eubacterium sp.]